MSRKPKITFVGPVYSQTTQKGRAGAEFTILQDGGAIKLEYASHQEASASRRTILADPLSHSVPTNKLLTAIQIALADAQG